MKLEFEIRYEKNKHNTYNEDKKNIVAYIQTQLPIKENKMIHEVYRHHPRGSNWVFIEFSIDGNWETVMTIVYGSSLEDAERNAKAFINEYIELVMYAAKGETIIIEDLPNVK